MNKYTNILKSLLNDFSYQRFTSLLKEIDCEIINNNIHNFDSEFMYYFKQIIGMVNDQYLVDDKPGTLGHMLIENSLLNKERLSPTLVMCFFLEQKKMLGLDDCCNTINFANLNGGNYNMKITQYHETGKTDLSINWKHFADLKKNTDEYNYEMMWTILHELTHVYQSTRTEDTENAFDKIVYYDYQKSSTLINNGGVNSNMFFHQALLSEFMADEQAHVFMLHLAQKHPEYFNPELIQQKLMTYQNRKSGVYGDYGADPRKAFSTLIFEIKKTFENYSNTHPMRIMLAQIEELEQKSLQLITELQMQGISEKGYDCYYNIYLKSLCQFDGENIILNNEMQNKSSKGI